MDAIEQQVAQLTQDPTVGSWVLVNEEFILGGGPYDPKVVAALRRADPAVAPLWVRKTYRRPDGILETVGRWLLARYVPDPREQISIVDFEARGIRGVAVPSVVPDELKGLPSAGPYLECELLETYVEDEDETGKPGEYMPLTAEYVRLVEISTHAIRNHRISDLALDSLKRRRAIKASKERSKREEFRAALKATKAHRLLLSGELVRVPSSYGGNVSISEGLSRLRKITAGTDEGVTA